METNIILGIVLAVSFAVNIILYRLASWQAKDLANIGENVVDLIEIIDNYGKHLKAVYELDSFYGDETLKALLEHTMAVKSLLEEQYSNVSSIVEPIEYDIKEGDEYVEEENDQKEKHVLYGGTRTSNS